MKILVLCIMVLLLSPFAQAKDPDIEVQSTQGIEINSAIEKLKPSKQNINDQRDIKNRAKRFIKTEKTLNKQNLKKIQKQKEINYLKNRLEIKKDKLEELFPNEMKGEKE